MRKSISPAALHSSLLHEARLKHSLWALSVAVMQQTLTSFAQHFCTSYARVHICRPPEMNMSGGLAL